MKTELEVIRVNEDVIATSCDHGATHYYKVGDSYIWCLYDERGFWNPYGLVDDEQTKNKLARMDEAEFLSSEKINNMYYFKNGIITKCEGTHDIIAG